MNSDGKKGKSSKDDRKNRKKKSKSNDVSKGDSKTTTATTQPGTSKALKTTPTSTPTPTPAPTAASATATAATSSKKAAAATATTMKEMTKATPPAPPSSPSTGVKTTTAVASGKNSSSAQSRESEERQRMQFFIAEAESAPKHLNSYTTQEKISEILGATYHDGPSCSRIITATIAKTAVQPSPQALNANSNQQSSEPAAKKTRTTKSVFSKRDPEIEADFTYGTVRPIDTEIVMETNNPGPTPASSVRSLGSLVCRICHNSENPERLVSPCLCKGSLSFVHIHCLERWISTSRSTICELCQFQYNTEQTLRYTCIQSLRMWYSRTMSRRALQEDCQMFSLLTLVAFGIIGTLLVGIQYYFIQGRHWGLSSMWTKGWLLFFLFTTLLVYFINIYMILRSQLAPWYRWWQSARDIKLILENRKPFKIRRIQRTLRQSVPNAEQQAQPQQQQQQQPQQPQPQQQQPPASPILGGGPSVPQTVTTVHRPMSTQSQSQSQPQSTSISMPLPMPSSIQSPIFPSSKLESSCEQTGKGSSEIIEIPFDVFDNYTHESVAPPTIPNV